MNKFLDVRVRSIDDQLEITIFHAESNITLFFMGPNEFVNLAAKGLHICSEIFLNEAEAIEEASQGDLLNSVGPHSKVIES